MPTTTTQHAIRPTLYIGLGGTGKEVLLRLRRRMYERFGTPAPPSTRFLWMDTDTKDVDARGEALDATMMAVGFQEQERVALLTGSVGRDAVDVFNNKQRWSYVHDWLYDEVERFGAEIGDGAGGVRAVGRLMFMMNFVAVEAAVKNAIVQLKQPQTITDTVKFYREHRIGEADMDPHWLPAACLVSSVAGGTGAGTLLDVSFLLRNLHLRFQELANIASYVFMPNVYYTDPKASERALRSYGNAYAALKELEHFCLRISRETQQQGGDVGIDFNVTWQDGSPQKITGPPVSVTYLLEMANTAGIRLMPDNRRELFSAVAESLYLDLLPGKFATAKRSDYSNIVQSLSGDAGINSRTRDDVILPQTFSRRFATFGLSKIEVPQDMIRAACGAQLGADIVGYILRDLSDANVGMDARNDLAQALIDRDGLPSLFGDEWKTLIRRAVDAVFRNVTLNKADDVNNVGRQLEELEDRLTRATGNDKVKWGDAVKHLRGSAGKVTEDAKKRLETLLRERALEYPSRGLRTALRDGGYVDELLAALKALGAPEEAGSTAVFPSQRTQALEDAEANKAERQRHLRDLREAVTSVAARAYGLRGWLTQVAIDRLRESAAQVLLCQAEAVLFTEANKTAAALIKALAQQRVDLAKFADDLQLVAQQRRDRSASLQQVESADQVLILRLYDREQHWDTFYRLGRDDDNNESLAVDGEKEYRRFADTFGSGTGVIELVSLRSSMGPQKFGAQLDTYCDGRFADDFQVNPRAVDVLDHPVMKERRQEYLQRLVNAALPMLQQEARFGSMKSEVAHVCYVGLANPDVSPYREVGEEIARLVGARANAPSVQVLPTGNPSEIYLYLSDYAFSLALLPIVTRDAHDSYWAFYEKANQGGPGTAQQSIPLHLSKRWEGKFEDLVVYTDQEASTLRQIFSILLFGPMLRILTLKSVKEVHAYSYMMGVPFSRLDSLGHRRQVVAMLRKDEQARGVFAKAIDERERALTSEQLVAYHHAVQAVYNAPDVIRGTPDDRILGQKLKELSHRPDEKLQLDIKTVTDINEALRHEYLRKLENSGLEWALDAYPVVKDLAIWEKKM